MTDGIRLWSQEMVDRSTKGVAERAQRRNEVRVRRAIRRVFIAAAAVLLLAACGGPSGDPERGEELYRQQELGGGAAPGCISCHSLDPGEVKVGPSHATVGARAEEIVADPAYQGQATTAAGYLRESILEPNAHVVQGFDASVMYRRYEEVLSDQQVDDLVAFLMTLR